MPWFRHEHAACVTSEHGALGAYQAQGALCSLDAAARALCEVTRTLELIDGAPDSRADGLGFVVVQLGEDDLGGGNSSSQGGAAQRR